MRVSAAVSRPTIQIRLAQPPIYLMGAVVLASLLPLFVQAFDGTSVGVEHLRQLMFAGVHIEQPASSTSAIPMVEDEQPEDEIEIVEPEPEADLDESEPLETTSATRHTASVTGKARAACARNDKASARAAYKSLKLGDPRRKAIRRSCRESGVWIL